jgi:replicative DNA helicase
MEKISEYLQDSIISLLINDNEFLNLCKSSVPVDVFDGKTRQDLCQMVYDYFDKFKTSPKDDIKDYINLSDEESKVTRLYRIYLRKIKDLEINKKYVISKLVEWVQYQQITGAVLKSAELIQENKLEEVKQTILEAFNTKMSVMDMGHDFWDWEFTGDEGLDIACKIGIDSMDRKLGGYVRGELFLWLGALGRGKSWALIDGAKSALLQGKNVVLYPLEMTAENTQKRIGMAMSRMKREVSYDDIIVTFKDGDVQNYKDTEVISTKSEKYQRKKEFYKKRKGKLIVKQGVGKKWTVDTITAHLNQLEMAGFVPDVIFIDYGDLLTSSKKFNNDLDITADVYIGLRELAKERFISVVSATQGNREALEARRVRISKMAGNIEKGRIADVIVTMSQTDEEKNDHEMRLFGGKVREGASSWTIRIKQAYEIGCFCLEDEEIFGDCDD